MRNKKVFIQTGLGIFLLLVVSFLFLRIDSARVLWVGTSSAESASASGQVRKKTSSSIKADVPAISSASGSRTTKRVTQPKWLKELITSHEKYYPAWKQQKTSGVVLKPIVLTQATNSESAPAPSSAATPEQSTTQLSPVSSQPTPTGSPVINRQVTLVSTNPEVSGPSNRVYGSSSSRSSSSGTSQSQDNQTDSAGGKESSSNEPSTNAAVSIIRTINRFEGGAYISLKITVTGQTSGLIVTEIVPTGYSISSSSPTYARKKNNTYKWLLYGKSISDQSISYEVRGTGSGNISGSFNSNSGSGNITGDSLLGS